MSDKKILRSSAPNRASRRASDSDEKHLTQTMLKSKANDLKIDRATSRRLGVAKRIKLTKARTEKRDKLRKKIAKDLGVNWKRVILTTKIVDGRADFTIKK